jgi:purine-binding chemotaxis protein CheW
VNGRLHLIARVAGRAVAIPADQVESAIDLGPLTPVPLAAAGVVGLAALRSRIVTVIDPRVVLGIAEAAALPNRAVVTIVDGHAYAILVEALDDVAEFDTVPLPAGVSLEGRWAGAGTALIDRAGEPVLVVALAALVPHANSLAA